MENSISSLQIANLTLQGAVMALCMELVIRSLFIPSSQKSWLVRGLKIVMATTMLIKVGIFSAFSSSSLQGHCALAGRIADSFYQISSIVGICILLLRVKVVIPIQHQHSVMILHVIIVVLRFGISIVDIVSVRIWTDPDSGVCRYKDSREIGITYTLFDTVADVYVTFMVTFILCMHIRRLHRAHLLGSNRNLYISVVLTNVIRTTILSILNIICTVYYITRNEDPTTVMITWPINNLFFIILIGYDTNIATSIRNLRSLVFRDINQKKYELPTHASHPHQQEQSSMSLPDIEQQFSCVINEPLTSGSTRLTRDNSRLRRQSTMAALDANEDQVFNTKLPVIHSGISDNSTLNSNTNNKPNRTRHSSC